MNVDTQPVAYRISKENRRRVQEEKVHRAEYGEKPPLGVHREKRRDVERNRARRIKEASRD